MANASGEIGSGRVEVRAGCLRPETEGAARRRELGVVGSVGVHPPAQSRCSISSAGRPPWTAREAVPQVPLPLVAASVRAPRLRTRRGSPGHAAALRAVCLVGTRLGRGWFCPWGWTQGSPPCGSRPQWGSKHGAHTMKWGCRGDRAFAAPALRLRGGVCVCRLIPCCGAMHTQPHPPGSAALRRVWAQDEPGLPAF